MFSDIMKDFNYQLNCITRNSKGSTSDIRKMIPDGNVELYTEMKTLETANIWANIKSFLVIVMHHRTMFWLQWTAYTMVLP
jgi:hypothetical protein